LCAVGVEWSIARLTKIDPNTGGFSGDLEILRASVRAQLVAP